MLEYIAAVKRGFRDQYRFVPDGAYPMEIRGKTDNVLLKDGRLFVCRFDEEKNDVDA